MPSGWPCCSTARKPNATTSADHRLRNARLRHPDASIEDVDYRTPRRLDKTLFQQLARGRWIAANRI